MTKRFTLLRIENLDKWTFGISHVSHFEANCSAMSRFMVDNRLSAGWARCVALCCCWCPELASCCDCIWCLTGRGNWHMSLVSHGNSTFHRQSWQHVTFDKKEKKKKASLTVMYGNESCEEKREKTASSPFWFECFPYICEQVDRPSVIIRESRLCLFLFTLSRIDS